MNFRTLPVLILLLLVLPLRINFFLSFFFILECSDFYISPVIQYFCCGRCDHTKTQYKSMPRCPVCSTGHLLECYPVTNNSSCLFCKGNHYSPGLNSRLSEGVCREFMKQKFKFPMAFYNFSFYGASTICFDHPTPNKSSHELMMMGNFHL